MFAPTCSTGLDGRSRPHRPRGVLLRRTLRASRMKKPGSDAAWWAGVLTTVVGLVVAVDAGGAVGNLCQKPNGLVILRSGACKPSETSVGTLGEPGPMGPAGAPGPVGPTGPTGSGVLGAAIVRTNPVTLNGAAQGMIVSSQALCQSTERLLSGGVFVDATEPNDLSHLSVIQSAPLAPADNGWLVEVLATSAINGRLVVTASALCLVQ